MMRQLDDESGRIGSRAVSRRQMMLGAIGLGGAVPAGKLFAQVATPEASPVASPAATPEPVTPLRIVREDRPIWTGVTEPGGDLRLATRVANLDDFSPTAFRQDFQVTASYLDPLIWLDEVDLTPRPWLAERWSWSADGLELTIELRTDVLWHDGTPLTAADVQFSMLCYRDDYDSAVYWMFAVVADVQAPDATTVRVIFDEPDGAFPYIAGNLPVFSRSQYEGYWQSQPVGERTLSRFDWKASPPIGTGPWRVQVGSSTDLTLVRNERHFASPPLTERLHLRHEPDMARQVDAWRADELDLAWPVPGDRVESLLQEEGYLFPAGAMVSMFAAYNFGNPLRNDPGWMASPNLREALTLAIDREAYAREVFGGFIDVERAGFMTQPWAVDPSVVNPKRNVAEANRLLDEAGWVDWDGDGIRDSPSGDRGAFVCIVRSDADPGLLATLDRLNDDLTEVGFALEVEQFDPDAFTQRWTAGFDYDLIALTLTQYGAFAEFDLVGSAWSIRRNSNGWNPGGYWNPEVDEAIASYLGTWKQADMVAALNTIQRATNDDPFALWLGFPQQPVLVRPSIAGFQPNRVWQSWNTASLWRQQGGAMLATPTPTPVPPTPTPTEPPATPAATPLASPVATPLATPSASPVSRGGVRPGPDRRQ